MGERKNILFEILTGLFKGIRDGPQNDVHNFWDDFSG
jgi:hypothetical protein